MLKPSLQLKLTQQLTMTPQLQQAIRLLQLPIMELQTQIQTALDENVMLEMEEPESPVEDSDTAESGGEAESSGEGETDAQLDMEMASEPAEDFTEAAVAQESDWEDTQKTGPSETPKSAEPPPTIEYADRSEETLRDHLL